MKRKFDVIYLPLHRELGDQMASENYWAFNTMRIAHSSFSAKAYVGHVSEKTADLILKGGLNIESFGLGKDRTIGNDLRFYFNLFISGLRNYRKSRIFHHYGSFGFGIGVNPFFMVMPKFGRKYIVGPILYPSYDDPETQVQLGFMDKIHKYGSIASAIFRIANIMTLIKVDLIVYDSIETMELYTKAIPWLKSKKWEIMKGGGISEDDFPPKDYKKSSGNEVVFGIASNLIKRKNVDLFIKAIASYDDAYLKIAGTGPEESSLKLMVSEMNLQHRIQFCGRIEHRDIWKFYHDIDVYVTINDAPIDLKISAQEAMITGTPVISGDKRMGISTKIQAWGIEINPFSTTNLRESILYFLNNKNNLTMMASKARLYALENFSNKHVNELLKVLYDIGR